MTTHKYTREICEAIWARGGTIKSHRSGHHLVFHTTLAAKPLVFAKTGKGYTKQRKFIEQQIDRHIKYQGVK